MVALTINLAALGLFNAALGFFVSYGIGVLFPDFTDEWKKEIEDVARSAEHLNRFGLLEMQRCFL